MNVEQKKTQNDKKRYLYISDYYDAIASGEIIAGKYIKQWYKMVIENLDKNLYDFSAKKANRAIRFIETFCRHSEGVLGGQLIHLELWQKAFLACIFGVLDKEGFRQFREVVLEIGRKNGKTLMAAGIATYMSFDGEYGSNILFAAPKIEQANLCYNATYQMIDTDKELAQLAKKRRTDIYLKKTNTSIKPIAFSAKKSDGFNPTLCVADEIASWPGAAGLKQYEVLKSACGSRKAPLILSISTNGYENDGIFDELIRRSIDVINGNSNEKRLAPFLYCIDDPAKWNDINELKKSNPNMNVSVSENFFLDEIAVAENSFSKRSEFLCKYANIKTNGSTAWLSSDVVANATKEKVEIDKLRSHYCVCGVDLSMSTDLTAAVIIVEDAGKLYCIGHAWLPENKLEKAIEEDGLPYDKYLANGWLSLSGTDYINYTDITKWILKHYKEYKLVPIITGYDRYNSRYWTEEMKSVGLRTEPISQGPCLSTAIDEVEERLANGTLIIGDNTLLRIHLLNASVSAAKDGKRAIGKIAKRDRIDLCAALLDAIATRRYFNPEIGTKLANIKK